VGGLTVAHAWEDVRWLAGQWGGPFMLKGVTRVDDAKRAVDAGATAISVSTTRQRPGRHPGRDPVLPPIAAAVGDQVEVVLDGGIRRAGRGQGGGAGRPGGDDRPRLPMGPGRQRAGRRRERARHLRGGIDSALLASATPPSTT